MKRFSHFIVLAIKRRIPLRKRKESTLAKLTGRKLRVDPLESRDLLSCVGLANSADIAVLDETLGSSNVEYRSSAVVGASQDVDVIYFDLDDEPFCGPLPKDVHEAYMRWMQMGCGLSAAESDAIIETHFPDNTNDPVDCVKPVAASQAVIQPYNPAADVLDVEVTTYTAGSGGSSSGSGGSSGGSHEYCSHAPWLCGGLGSSSSGGASGGSSNPGLYLITNDDDEIELQLSAGDADETIERDENLQLAASNLPVKEVIRVKNGTSYTFTVKLDVSSYSALNGSFKVVDCHGRESASVDVCVRPVKITGFEIQEKAPGADAYTFLEDDHVVWQENSRRYYFHTLGDVDMDDPVDYAAFMNLFTYQVKGQAWTWDSTENDYVRSNAWNSLNGDLGVYNLQIDLYANNQKFDTLDDNGRYCFNAVSSVAWENAQIVSSPGETSSHLKLISDGSNGYKAFVEQPLNMASGALNPEKKIATARVALAVQLPVGMSATVYVDWFDPDNPIGSTITASGYGKGKRDNHGSISNISNNVLTFNVQNGTQYGYVELTIDGGYAGDNYIVAAHPNFGVLGRAEVHDNTVAVPVTDNDASGGSSSSGGSSGSDYTYAVLLEKTSLLTVWRSLWIERDRMEISQGTDDSKLADLVPIDGFVQTELARACIDLREHTKNEDRTVAGQLTLNENVSMDPYATSRNLDLPTDSFWTITSIGCFSDEDRYGYFRRNNVFVFSDKIKTDVETYNSLHGTNLSKVNAIRRTTLHEIGHAFDLHDIYVEDRATITEDTVGVMVSGSKWYWGDRLLMNNRSFTVDNLRLIQNCSKPVISLSSSN